MKIIFYFQLILSFAFQNLCGAENNHKFIIIFGNQFEGQLMSVKIGNQFQWSQKLVSMPETGFADYVVGHLNVNLFKISIEIENKNLTTGEFNLKNGRYILINYNPINKDILVRQTSKLPKIFAVEPDK